MKKIIKSMIKNEGNIYRTILNKNINHLSLFLKGYLYCGNISKTLTNEEKIFQESFTSWVYTYYHIIESDNEWDELILFMNFNSTEQSVDIFFKLYKQWHKEEFGEDAW